MAAHQIVESSKLPAQGLGPKDRQLSVPGDSGRHSSFSDEQASYEPDPEVYSEDLRNKQEHLKSGQGQGSGFEVSLPFFLGGLLQHLDARNQTCARGWVAWQAAYGCANRVKKVAPIREELPNLGREGKQPEQPRVAQSSSRCPQVFVSEEASKLYERLSFWLLW